MNSFSRYRYKCFHFNTSARNWGISVIGEQFFEQLFTIFLSIELANRFEPYNNNAISEFVQRGYTVQSNVQWNIIH